MQGKVSLEYAIVSLLANLSTDVSSFTTKKPLLHQAFFKFRKQKISFFQDVPFDTSYFPYSESIEQAFDNLEMSGLICKTNPVFQKFNLDREALTSFYHREIETTLSDKQRKEIKKLAEQFPAMLHS